jgi:Family of unknown function (DUF6152)
VRNRIFAVLVGAGMLVPAGTLLAHHSPSAIFNMKKVLTLKGTVTKVDWVNPHIVMFMDVKDDSGKVENWKFESNPPRWFTKVGVNRADFAAAIGQTVTVEIVAAIDGSKYGYLHKITFPNGNEISLVEGQKEEIRP